MRPKFFAEGDDVSDKKKNEINLQTPLSWFSASRFPLQSAAARKDLFIGFLWMFVPVIGWLMNLGHRVQMVNNMQNGLPAWPAWKNHPRLLKHGVLTFLGMVMYHLPSIAAATLARAHESLTLWIVAIVLWLLGTIAVPGYMTHYCFTLDPREIFNPALALRRVGQGGKAYWRAWLHALWALALSFVGLLFFGIGFLYASVWFWQVAGFSFASAFTQHYNLQKK